MTIDKDVFGVFLSIVAIAGNRYNPPMNRLTQNYTAVNQNLIRAAQQAGRNPNEITLIAVTKTWPAETILAAYEVGMRHFGENRAEELAQKRPFVENILGKENGITWHFIGTVQSRKAKLIADFADVFHALDRLKIANKIANRLAENGRFLSTFLEVNLSGEASKSGFNCTEWETNATQQAELRTVLNTIAGLPGLSLDGLMTMAPWHSADAEIRSVFTRTQQLGKWVKGKMGEEKSLQLSMGMTNDFPIAIASGATHIRVGRAIFGERH